MIKTVKSGVRSVAEPHTYLRCAYKISEITTSHQKQKTQMVDLHGDLTVDRFLFDEAKVTARGFRDLKHGPAGIDTAHLLVDFTIEYGDPNVLELGQIVPENIQDIFFDEYNCIARNDVGFSFQSYISLLDAWYGIPSDPHKRSIPQEIRLEKILKIAEIGFQL